MAESTPRFDHTPVVRVEPDDRLVVLARTIEARNPAAEPALVADATDGVRFGETCLGRALYRHRSVFRNATEALVWSHLELSYFRNVVPAEVISELVVGQQPPQATLLRAEILLTTPSAFLLPRGWNGLSDRPGTQASLEYIDVKSAYLGEYREIMKQYIGPAAATLVASGAIGTFRAMETAAVLYHNPELSMDWNQIHLCEVDPDGFEGFGQAFDAALRNISPDVEFVGVFAGLDRIRTIPRWTFGDPVVEADAPITQAGATKP